MPAEHSRIRDSRPRLAHNVGFNLAGQLIVLALNVLAVRQIDRGLGSDAVGLIFFAMTVNAVLTTVFDLGMSSTLVRAIAARPAVDHVVALVRTVGLISWAAYLAVATTLVLSAELLARQWLIASNTEAGTAGRSLAILLAASLLALPRSLYSSVFRGFQRMGTTNVIDVGTAAVQQFGITVLILAGGDLIAVCWWIAGSTAGGVAAYLLVITRIVPTRALVPGFSVVAVKAHSHYALQLTAISILAVLHTQADKLIVSRILPLGVFGMYAFAFSVLNRGMLLTGAVVQAALPALAAFASASGSGGSRREYRDLQHLVLYVMAAVFAVAPFAAHPITALVFGEATDDVGAIWLLLAIGFYMNATINMPYTLSLALGRPGIALALNAWALILVLPLTVLLVTRWGTVGAAASWVIYHVLAYAYAVPRFARECIGQRPIEWYGGVASYALPAAAVYGAMWLAAVYLLDASVLALGAAYAVGTAVYGMIGWTRLPEEVRDDARSLLLNRATS